MQRPIRICKLRIPGPTVQPGAAATQAAEGRKKPPLITFYNRKREGRGRGRARRRRLREARPRRQEVRWVPRRGGHAKYRLGMEGEVMKLKVH